MTVTRNSTKPALPSRASVEREIGLRGSLHDFVRMAWPHVEEGRAFSDNWHIRTICDHLEQVTRGELRQLMINVPPGTMKSLLVCVFWPVWEWIRSPKTSWMFASFDQGLTHRDAKRELKILQSEWFRARWPEVSVPSDCAIGEHENSAGGWRFATSVRGKATGRHPDRIIIDDPIKPKGITDLALEDVWEWWTGTLLSRGADPNKVSRVVIMQRLHAGDLCGRILDTAPPGAWTVLDFPMEAIEENNPHDPRTSKGALLWPERFSAETVQTLKRDIGSSVYWAQYQQRPQVGDGTIFKRSWFNKRYRTLPTDWDDACISWDMAFKGSSGSDYVVGQVWLQKGCNYYLADTVRARADFVTTRKMVLDLSARWPRVGKILVEDKANGPAIISSLDGVLGVIPVNPEGGKVARANAISPLCESGCVYLPEEGEWVSEYIEELCRFPLGAHDDQVDTTSQALSYLSAHGTGNYSKMLDNITENYF